jgi:hypothetical protein
MLWNCGGERLWCGGKHRGITITTVEKNFYYMYVRAHCARLLTRCARLCTSSMNLQFGAWINGERSGVPIVRAPPSPNGARQSGSGRAEGWCGLIGSGRYSQRLDI